MPYCFFRSSIKFEGYMGKEMDDLSPILSKITRPVAAIKSLRFALFLAATKQLYEWFSLSVRPSVYLSHLFTRGQFWPSGIVVACVCVCVCMCVCPSIMSLSVR